MSCPPNSDEQDLVSYWSFEDGSGSVVLDQTLNGNNGSLVNNAVWDTDIPFQSCQLYNVNGCDSNVYLKLND